MSRETTRGRLLLLVLVSLVVVAISCRPSIEDRSLVRIKEAGELVVGVDPSYPPFAAIDGQGQLIGYDVDLASYVAGWLGVRARFVSIDIGSIQDGLLAKKFDVIISSLPPFPEFTRDISYSRPYFNAGQVLVVNQNTHDVSRLEDLVGRSLGVEGASAADIEVRKLVSKSDRPMNIAIRSFATPDALLAALKANSIDAAIVDVVTATEHAQREKGVRVAGEPLTVEPYVVAVRRADRLLLQEIDSALAVLVETGREEKLRGKWMGADRG